MNDNVVFADMLREMASLLDSRGDNAWRVGAYRKAADTIAALPRSVREVFEREGLAGLDALPTVGPGIAAAIGEIAQTGRWSRLDRLRGTVDPSAVFRTIPGVGPQLAQRLHDGLDVDSLEALEGAAHDGRLERLPQMGARRAAAWLPVLHSRRGEWHFTALFSNTARAHELGHVRDWVVIYAEDEEHHERQYTVVTA